MTEMYGLDGQPQAVSHPALEKGSRGVMLAFGKATDEIPKDVVQKLNSKQLKLTDRRIYAIRMASGKTIKMFETQDQKEIGLRNVDKNRLNKDEVFALTGIQVLAAYVQAEGEGAGLIKASDDILVKRATFHTIDTAFPEVVLVGRDASGAVVTVAEGEKTALTSTSGVIIVPDSHRPFAGLETGVFTLRANRKDLIVEMPLTVFKSNPEAPFPGYFGLDNPKIIKDDVAIEFDFTLGEELDFDGAEEAVHLIVILHGSATTPA